MNNIDIAVEQIRANISEAKNKKEKSLVMKAQLSAEELNGICDPIENDGNKVITFSPPGDNDKLDCTLVILF